MLHANQILGCICRGSISRDRDVIIPLCACHSVSGLLHLVLTHTIKKKKKKRHRLERVQKGVMKMNRRVEILLCEERLKELGLFNLLKGWEHLITPF